MRKLLTLTLLWMMISAGPIPELHAQATSQPGSINTIDGAAGPCSIELTVLDPEAKPVYSALINVRIAYGFRGLRKLDLSVYTNNAGMARFTGLPDKVRKPPVVFRASKDKESGEATYNPATECQAKHDIVLQKP